jgi:UDP-glucose 4-epimerase
MRMLVTGGAGFLGSHICEKYVKEGHTVVCLDNFSNSSTTNIRQLLKDRNFKLVQGDIRNAELVNELVHDTDVIIHLAAQIHIDRSVLDPQTTFETNVMGTLNILEAARRYDVKKMLHASTSEVYGTALYAPMDEAHPLNAIHPYGASKIAADRTCYGYINTYGMDIAIIRMFNMFGPRQKDTGFGSVISLFTKRALNNKPPIIYGDGNQRRDYTYVNDAIDAYDLILNYKKIMHEPINFGTGKDVRINDLANIIIKLAGKEGKLTPVHVEQRHVEVERLISNATLAKKLGWKPKYTLEEGLAEFVEWYKNYRIDDWETPEGLW